MWKILAIALIGLFLSGCADTPENRDFWQRFAQGLQGAGDNLNRQAQQMRDSSSGVNNTNCTTTYYGNTAQTTCSGPQQRSTNCTTTYYGSTAQTNCY